jgi:hypothetical protein
MIRSLAACLLVMPLAACVTEPMATTPSTNPDLHVDTLFTHDGCTVYRFRDLGYHYYVRCGGAGPTETVSTLSCRGKGCSNEDAIPTLSSWP